MQEPIHCLVAFFGAMPLARLVVCFVFGGDLATCEAGGISVCYYHSVGVVYVCPPVGVWHREVAMGADGDVVYVDALFGSGLLEMLEEHFAIASFDDFCFTSYLAG